MKKAVMNKMPASQRRKYETASFEPAQPAAASAPDLDRDTETETTRGKGRELDQGARKRAVDNSILADAAIFDEAQQQQQQEERSDNNFEVDKDGGGGGVNSHTDDVLSTKSPRSSLLSSLLLLRHPQPPHPPIAAGTTTDATIADRSIHPSDSAELAASILANASAATVEAPNASHPSSSSSSSSSSTSASSSGREVVAGGITTGLLSKRVDRPSVIGGAGAAADAPIPRRATASAASTAAVSGRKEGEDSDMSDSTLDGNDTDAVPGSVSLSAGHRASTISTKPAAAAGVGESGSVHHKRKLPPTDHFSLSSSSGFAHALLTNREDPIGGEKKKTRASWTGNTIVFWTPAMDERLREGHDLYGHLGRGKWKSVAEHVGAGVDNMQCLHRWNNYVKPETARKSKMADWTKEEDNKLREIVEPAEKYIAEMVVTENDTQLPEKSLNLCVRMHRGLLALDWVAISAQMDGISARSCSVRWNENLKVSTMRKGPFHPKEDEIILATKRQWKSGKRNKRGLWVALEKELGRSSKNILSHWMQSLSKRVPEGDLAADGVGEEEEEGEGRRAGMREELEGLEYYLADGQGGFVRKRKRRRRSNKKPDHLRVRKERTFWTPELDERLREAFEAYGRDGRGRWMRIAEHVGGGATNMRCCNRWYNLGNKGSEGGSSDALHHTAGAAAGAASEEGGGKRGKGKRERGRARQEENKDRIGNCADSDSDSEDDDEDGDGAGGMPKALRPGEKGVGSTRIEFAPVSHFAAQLAATKNNNNNNNHNNNGENAVDDEKAKENNNNKIIISSANRRSGRRSNNTSSSNNAENNDDNNNNNSNNNNADGGAFMFGGSGVGIGVGVVLGAKEKRSRRVSTDRMAWTGEMDERLREGFELYGEKGRGRWMHIAEHVGGGVTNMRCCNRWSRLTGEYRQPQQQDGEDEDQ